MRFESVTAHAFGRLRRETLEIAPGMNVIYGVNEAGKSTWHAALYAGLCGMRRRRGRARTDRDFQTRYKPWSGGVWEVETTIALEGRRVTLRHDFNGRVDSSARDADLAGRDYSAEIMNEGAPDGARWLWLDRRSFLSTACVRQASILAVLDDPLDLQDELQSAASTAGTGETAAEALEILNNYRTENVGTERSPTRPLVRSQRALRIAQDALASARDTHAQAARRSREVDSLNFEAQRLERELNATRAVLAEAAAQSEEQRLHRVRILTQEFPEGEPPYAADDSGLAEQVVRALEHWNDSPSPDVPQGPTMQELQVQLDDENLRLAVLAEIEALAAAERLNHARELSAKFPEGAPRRLSEDNELAQAVTRALAIWDARPIVGGKLIDELRLELDELDQQLTPAVGGGLGAMLRAIMQWFARLFGLAPRVSEQNRSELAERRIRIEREINDAERAEGALVALRDVALRVGLPGGSPEALVESLREWQEKRDERISEADARFKDWEQLQRLLGTQTIEGIQAESVRLRNQATSRAAVIDGSQLSDAVARPLNHSEVVELKERTSEVNRTKIQNHLRIREEEDLRFQEATLKRAEAASQLLELTVRIGSEVVASEDQESALQQWLEQRRHTLEENHRKLNAWEDLQRLLGERTLDELEEETKALRRVADSLMANSAQEELEKAQARQPSKGDVDTLNECLLEARERHAKAQGELTEFKSGLLNVAEAQEQLEWTQAEFGRVRRLDQTLGTAISFLEAAQERAHRDIAPTLRATVLEYLEQLTDGRYVDCVLSPESLEVEVVDNDGRRRSASLLSHGTAEQLYLLLRLALAQHLTKPSGEICPLILDDVLSAADSDRKRRMLETLLAISESVQVILFTHEDDVRLWAEEHLTFGKDKLTLLATPGSS